MPNWYIRDGSKRVSTGKTDVTEAAAALARYKEDRTGQLALDGKAGVNTLSDLLTFWSEEYRAKPGSERQWLNKWRYVISTIGRHAGHKPLSTLTWEWSRGYVADRLSEGVEGPTVRQELQTILSGWKSAHGRRLTPLPPPEFDVPAASQARDLFLTKDEARRLLAECHMPHLRLFVRLGLATGARPGAITALQWRHVDLERGRVDFRASGQRKRGEDEVKRGKEKKAAMVPIAEDLVDELREARRIAQTDHVIEFAALPVASVKKSFAAAVKRAGLSKDVTPHVLRHSAATWMAQAGVPMWDIAGFLGHSSVKMVEEVYGHHSPDYMSRGRDALKL
jgi:integrase